MVTATTGNTIPIVSFQATVFLKRPYKNIYLFLPTSDPMGNYS